MRHRFPTAGNRAANVAVGIVAVLFTLSAEFAQAGEETMKVEIRIAGHAIPVTLEDNATTKDFVALLPLTLTLSDYASAEKISDLPKKLSVAGAPAGITPSIGDVTY